MPTWLECKGEADRKVQINLDLVQFIEASISEPEWTRLYFDLAKADYLVVKHPFTSVQRAIAGKFSYVH